MFEKLTLYVIRWNVELSAADVYNDQITFDQRYSDDFIELVESNMSLGIVVILELALKTTLTYIVDRSWNRWLF